MDRFSSFFSCLKDKNLRWMWQGAPGGGHPADRRVRASLLPPPKQPGELLLWMFRSTKITRFHFLFEEKKLLKAAKKTHPDLL